MRTTVTLDRDVAAKLKELAHRRRASFKETLNDVIRRGLAAQRTSGPRSPRFAVEPHASGLQPGIDAHKLNQLVDQLAAEDFVHRHRGGK